MERTTMSVMIVGILSTLAFFVAIIIGLGNAQQNATWQLSACSEAGGSYLTNDGSPLCLMPGQDVPLP